MDVPVTTIDTFVAERPGIAVALIKTDVEGHDLEALKGMLETVASHQPLILTECDRTAALSNMCVAWGYRIFAFTRGRKTLARRFVEMVDADASEHWYKMLFLVPGRLHRAFEDIRTR